MHSGVVSGDGNIGTDCRLAWNVGVVQTVAIVVFSALAFSFYVFFAPFLGTRTLKFIIMGVFTPLVCQSCVLECWGVH